MWYNFLVAFLDTEEASEADVGKGDDYMEIEIQEQ